MAAVGCAWWTEEDPAEVTDPDMTRSVPLVLQLCTLKQKSCVCKKCWDSYLVFKGFQIFIFLQCILPRAELRPLECWGLSLGSRAKSGGSWGRNSFHSIQNCSDSALQSHGQEERIRLLVDEGIRERKLWMAQTSLSVRHATQSTRLRRMESLRNTFTSALGNAPVLDFLYQLPYWLYS